MRRQLGPGGLSSVAATASLLSFGGVKTCFCLLAGSLKLAQAGRAGGAALALYKS
jgi:hypothetical protein